MKNSYFPAVATLRQLGLTALLAGGATLAAQAQALNYPASNAYTKAGTYTDLAGTGTVISTSGNYDDANSAATDIGFTFTFGGTAFTQFVLNTNGFIRLGATAPTTPYFSSTAQSTTASPLTGSNTNLILPFNTDLEAGTGGTEYRVATTGTSPNRVCTIQWKNVSDKGRAGTSGTIPKQLSNISFQVKLYEGNNAVEFVYGTATASSEATNATFVAVGLKGNGTATNQYTTITKASNIPWAQPTFQDGNYGASANAFNVRNSPTISGVTPAQLLPDPGRTYHFDVPTTNDATVAQLYNIEQLPVRQAFVYRAVVRNVGTNASSANTLTLTISGANSATVSQSVSSLVNGAPAVVITFPSVTLTNPGTNTVTVSLGNDGNNSNNTLTATTVTQASSATTEATFSYIKPNVPSNSSYGFTANAASFSAAFCAAYTPSTTFRVSAVRALIAANDATEGHTVFGVLADINGNILGQSPDFIVSNLDLGTLHTFTLPSPVQVAAGAPFLVGLGLVIDANQYYPMGLQPEVPQRPGTFYSIGVSTPGAPSDVSGGTTPPNSIFMVEAVGFGTTVSATSPELTRAFSLYPNPSTDGLFNLAVRGANAPAGLRVEVVNQLGQRVYTGAARDNFTSTLDLGGLTNGIYYLTVRNGDEYSTSKLSINR